LQGEYNNNIQTEQEKHFARIDFDPNEVCYIDRKKREMSEEKGKDGDKIPRDFSDAISESK
jgi:hypothetical protein